MSPVLGAISRAFLPVDLEIPGLMQVTQLSWNV